MFRTTDSELGRGHIWLPSPSLSDPSSHHPCAMQHVGEQRVGSICPRPQGWDGPGQPAVPGARHIRSGLRRPQQVQEPLRKEGVPPPQPCAAQKPTGRITVQERSSLRCSGAFVIFFWRAGHQGGDRSCHAAKFSKRNFAVRTRLRLVAPCDHIFKYEIVVRAAIQTDRSACRNVSQKSAPRSVPHSFLLPLLIPSDHGVGNVWS